MLCPQNSRSPVLAWLHSQLVCFILRQDIIIFPPRRSNWIRSLPPDLYYYLTSQMAAFSKWNTNNIIHWDLIIQPVKSLQPLFPIQPLLSEHHNQMEMYTLTQVENCIQSDESFSKYINPSQTLGGRREGSPSPACPPRCKHIPLLFLSPWDQPLLILPKHYKLWVFSVRLSPNMVSTLVSVKSKPWHLSSHSADLSQFCTNWDDPDGCPRIKFQSRCHATPVVSQHFSLPVHVWRDPVRSSLGRDIWPVTLQFRRLFIIKQFIFHIFSHANCQTVLTL